MSKIARKKLINSSKLTGKKNKCKRYLFKPLSRKLIMISNMVGLLTYSFNLITFPSVGVTNSGLRPSSYRAYSSGYCSGFTPDSLLTSQRLDRITLGQNYINILINHSFIIKNRFIDSLKIKAKLSVYIIFSTAIFFTFASYYSAL